MQKARHVRSRSGSIFNLRDETGDELLTHKGQALDGVKDEDQAHSSDDDLDAETVNQLHFGGGEGDTAETRQVCKIHSPCWISISKLVVWFAVILIHSILMYDFVDVNDARSQKAPCSRVLSSIMLVFVLL